MDAGAVVDAAQIFLVDDHPVVRSGLAQLINDEPDLVVCGEAPDAASAVGRIRETDPDLVIVDVSLQGTNGIELIKQVKAREPDRRMLVCSIHDEAIYAERALRAGAMGYINKQASPDKLVRAIRTVLRGKIYLSPNASQSALRRLLAGNETAGSAVEELSDRELEVFDLIGRGVTTREIAERLHLSVKTIETHRERIKHKLALRNGTELILRAVRWVLEGRESS